MDDDDEDMDLEELENDGGKSKPDDFMGVLMGTLALSNLKLAFFIFLIFLFVTSDIFVEHALSKWDGLVYNREPNEKGTVVQGIALVLLYMTIDILIRGGYL